MSLYEELAWRGFIHQSTHPEIKELIDKESMTLYCGFDPTADSLHVGSLLPIIGLMHFQRHGHTPIALMGGATGMIGDPSGKTQERQLLDVAQLEQNVKGQRAQLERFLDFTGGNAARIENNAAWLGELRFVEFLKDIGKYFSVNVMIARESVRARLEDREHGISYTEFSYQLLQAYDFLHLYDTSNCRLQIGGSDQWGNIVAGIDLTRRLRSGAATFGITFPLLTKADGSKFGKSEGGNIWLDAHRTSVYQFYQYWMNQADADTPRLLKLFTFLSKQEIEELEEEMRRVPEKRIAQQKLAEEITRLVHGEEALQKARRASQAIFGGDLGGMDDATLEHIFRDVPSTELPHSTLTGGLPLVDVLVQCNVFASKGEARRMVQSGGLYLNNERIDGLETKLTEQSLASERICVIRKGKKNYHLLKFT